jgi:hypothetical protein
MYFKRQGFVTFLVTKDAYLDTTGVHNSPLLFLYLFARQKTWYVEGMYLENAYI